MIDTLSIRAGINSLLYHTRRRCDSSAEQQLADTVRAACQCIHHIIGYSYTHTDRPDLDDWSL